MSDPEKSKGAVRRFIDILVGGEKEDPNERFDVRLARRLISEMNDRILVVGTSRFAPTIYRITLTTSDYESNQLDQGIVANHFDNFISSELAHEISKAVNSPTTSDDVTVTFTPSSHLESGKIQVESWYGSLSEGDTGDVVDTPSVSSSALLDMLKQAMTESSLTVSGKTFSPRHYAIWFNPDDYRFWTQYPHVFDALQQTVLQALSEASAIKPEQLVPFDEFFVQYHSDDKAGPAHVDIFASLDPIEITDDGSATSASPDPSNLTSDAIITAFLTQLRKSTIAIGKDILAPYYYIGKLSTEDYDYWTHYPEICRELILHIREALASRISEMLEGRIDEPVPYSDIKLGLTAAVELSPGAIAVEASLDPLDIPGVPDVSEPSTPTETDDTPDVETDITVDESESTTEVPTPFTVEPSSDIDSEPVTVQDEIPPDLQATVAERLPVRDVQPLLILHITDDTGAQNTHNIAVLPLMIGRTGGSASPGMEFLPLDNATALSRKHLTVTETESGFALQVAERTTNQTFLNDNLAVPGSSAALSSGDRVRIGLCEIEFEIPGSPEEHIALDIIRDSVSQVLASSSVSIGDTILSPPLLSIRANEANCTYWQSELSLVQELAPSSNIVFDIDDDLSSDALHVQAYWREDENRIPVVSGPSQATFDTLVEHIEPDSPDLVSCVLSLSPPDYDYWNQSETVLSPLTTALASAYGCPVSLQRSSSLSPGTVEAEFERLPAEEPSSEETASSVALLELRNRGDMDIYRVQHVPALVGRASGHVSDDVYYIELHNVREVSRKHFVLAVAENQLTINVIPTSVNPVRSASGPLPKDTPVPIEFDNDYHIGHIRLIFRPPEPPFGTYVEWQERLEAQAMSLSSTGDVLTVRLDPESYRFWTAYEQIQRVFSSMAGRAASTSSEESLSTLSTRVDSGAFSGFHVQLREDPALKPFEMLLARSPRDFGIVDWSTPVNKTSAPSIDTDPLDTPVAGDIESSSSNTEDSPDNSEQDADSEQ